MGEAMKGRCRGRWEGGDADGLEEKKIRGQDG